MPFCILTCYNFLEIFLSLGSNRKFNLLDVSRRRDLYFIEECKLETSHDVHKLLYLLLRLCGNIRRLIIIVDKGTKQNTPIKIKS